MSDCISLRISQIINELFEGNKSEFARAVGVSESAVRSYITGVTPKADVLEKIASGTAISCEWLVLGKGDMLTTAPAKAEPAATPDDLGRLLDVIERQSDQLTRSQEQVTRSQEQIDRLLRLLELSSQRDAAGGAASGASFG